MASAASARAVTSAVVDRFSRLSAGYRLIILLTLALLPLGLLAVVASLQISRSTDIERRATIRVAASESARRLAAELSADVTAIRSAANLLERGGDENAICARTLSVLSTSFNQSIRFAILTRGGRLVCGSPAMAAHSPRPDLSSDLGVSLLPEGMLVTLPSDTRAFVGLSFYPRARLSRVLRPTGLTAPYSVTISGGGGQALPIVEDGGLTDIQRTERIVTSVPNLPLSLAFEIRSAPFTPAEILTMLVPLIMWLVAVLIAWIVFNRLVISPLTQLRANVANYQPGDILQPLRRMTIPAREVEELGQSFRTISQTVAEHEAELERGLTRQTKLTREVHHRVKNNLQVVSSLINLHARAAPNPEARAAYATISRRVDALAVVHRNHYAELEESRGVNLRSLIGELSANLRATAPGEANRLAILIDVPPIYVGQDTAIPIAFVTTELVELAMTIDPGASIRISVLAHAEPDRASLIVGSPALREGDDLSKLLAERYGRVIEGLSRQLRSPMERDGAAGTFKLSFPVMSADRAA
jgi:two-component system, sensor histidine kinase PdtaS